MKKQIKTNWQTIVFATIAALVFIFAANTPAFAQTNYKVGDKVEVLYYVSKWYKAEVIEVKDGLYKVHFEGYDANFDEWVKPEKMRPLKADTPANNQTNPDNQAQNQTNEKRTDNQTDDKPKPTTKANEYGTRDPRTCKDKKAPARGAITAALAAKYVICDSEKVSGQYLYLVENVKVEIGGSRLYSNNETRGFTEIDVRFPIYAIRGSLVSYQCYREDENFPHSKPGKNCVRKNEPEAKGDCYKTLFGEWRCYMNDLSYKNENHFPGVAPPKP